MVYVDELQTYRSGQWCHLYADTPEELETMRYQLGLRAEWRHTSTVGGAPLHHYDLSPSKRALAVSFGAVETTAKEIVRKHKEVTNALP